MQIQQLSEGYFVCPQISINDLAILARHGFQAILCNRPDGEEPLQPGQQEIAETAKSLGIEFRYQPIVPGQITQADLAEFSKLLEELPMPVLAYCRTGARCTMLWNQTQSADLA